MHAVKFTVFYVIAAVAALASASPIPVAAPEAAVRIADIDVVAREPLPVADPLQAEPRQCMKRAMGSCL